MKNLTTKLTIAAAAFMAVAGVASAQTTEMRAKVPFAFRAGGKVFAAGTYRVEVQHTGSGNPLVLVRGTDPEQQLLTVGTTTGDVKKAWEAAGQAVLSFECGVSRCALHDIWMGRGGGPVYQIPAPGLGKDEPRHTAEVVMQQVKAD